MFRINLTRLKPMGEIMLNVGDKVAVYQYNLKRKGRIASYFSDGTIEVIIQESPLISTQVHPKQCRRLKPPEKSIRITKTLLEEACKKLYPLTGAISGLTLSEYLGLK